MRLITVQLSVMEVAMIKKLRQYPTGEFTVYKIDGEPRRVTKIIASEMLQPRDGESLEQPQTVNIPPPPLNGKIS